MKNPIVTIRISPRFARYLAELSDYVTLDGSTPASYMVDMIENRRDYFLLADSCVERSDKDGSFALHGPYTHVQALLAVADAIPACSTSKLTYTDGPSAIRGES